MRARRGDATPRRRDALCRSAHSAVGPCLTRCSSGWKIGVDAVRWRGASEKRPEMHDREPYRSCPLAFGSLRRKRWGQLRVRVFRFAELLGDAGEAEADAFRDLVSDVEADQEGGD